MSLLFYTPHEGLSWANQKSRKLGLFGRKLGESNFIDILIDITYFKRKWKIMCKVCLTHLYEIRRYQNDYR